MTNTRTDAIPNGSLQFFVFSGLVFAISVAVTIYFSRSMSGGMEMQGEWTMSMMWMRMPEQTWTASAAMFMLMWLTMMVAMMLPSALPMLLNFRQSLIGNENRNFGAPVIFAASGYFVVWLALGAAVYLAGVIFALAAMRLEGFSRMVPALSGAALMAAGAIQLTAWKMSGLRRCRTSGCAELPSGDALKVGWCHGLKQGAVCLICCLAPTPEDEAAVYVTNLELCDATLEQVALLYAQCADTENVFDELKNQWGFRGYCSGRAVVTELAARLVLLTYNLWSLFTRLMGLNPGQHTEAIKSRRNFFVHGGASGRKRTATHAETGGRSRVVACVKRLLPKAADVVDDNCAAVGIPRELPAPAHPSNHQ